MNGKVYIHHFAHLIERQRHRGKMPKLGIVSFAVIQLNDDSSFFSCGGGERGRRLPALSSERNLKENSFHFAVGQSPVYVSLARNENLSTLNARRHF